MKNLLLSSFAVLVAILLVVACDTTTKLPVSTDDSKEGAELNIPASFLFNTTRLVSLTLDGAGLPGQGALVEVYDADPSANGRVIHRVFVNSGDMQDARINMPTRLETLWFVTIMANGIRSVQSVPAQGKVINVQVAGGTVLNAPNGLIARYLFNEGFGTEVFDQSGYGTPLNLELGAGVNWIPGRNGVEFTAPNSVVRSNVAATKILDELMTSGQFTFEVWGTPANTTQSGPARIISISDTPFSRNFTVGQSGTGLENRLRTTGTGDNNGIPGHVIGGVVTTNETHFVVTYDGTDLSYYQDGVFVGSVNRAGNLSNWDTTFELLLGNEATLDRGWLGEIYQASIYNEALDASDIADNFAAGSLIPFLYTFDNPFPAEDVFGTLAYEDLWPSFGDYDMNDLVIGYNMVEATDLDNRIHEIEFRFAIRALGAAYDSGFGIEFPVPYSRVASVTGARYTEGLISLNPNGTEAGQTNAVVIMWDDSAFEMGKWVNTENPANHVAEDSLTITVAFDPPVTRAEIGNAPYNPFTFIEKDRGREVHLPGFEPTELADPSFFGTIDDTTDLVAGRFYKSATGLNWAINIPEEVPYPLERVSILEAYLKFQSWAESGGVMDTDWYLDLPGHRDNSKLYIKP